MVGLYPKFKAGSGTLSTFLTAFKQCTNLELYPFSCGRAAMVFGLRAIGMTRNEEIYVPPFLSHCVLSALLRTAFPVLKKSNDTKAIFVYHQFGFPQKIDQIEQVAKQRRWYIINDAANTLFSQYRGRSILSWGDFSIVSLAKLFPSILGGGLITHREKILQSLVEYPQENLRVQKRWAGKARKVLVDFHRRDSDEAFRFEVESVYGYIPEVIPMSDGSMHALPQTKSELLADAERRRFLWQKAKEILPNNTPHCPESNVVPFAIPIVARPDVLTNLSAKIKKQFDLETPILHFDYNRNMLKSDYQKSLIIGCHAQWHEDTVINICNMIKRTL